jgi:pyrimidine-specific ribonucleoside hydrolase
MKKIPLIIDCDPGVDDAVAIILAHHIEKFSILAITSVAGNADIDLTTYNSLMIADWLKMNCIVAKGAPQPLVKEKHTSYHTHGEDGIGGASRFSHLHCHKALSKHDALTIMRDILIMSNEKVSIAAIGPLTNIALLLKVYPEVKDNIEVISIMGGGINHGNVTPCSEFNFFVDPEAASIVFNSGVPLIMSGIHLTVKATLTEEDMRKIKDAQGPLSEIGFQMIGDYTSKDTALHDPCAILALSHPELFEGEELFVQIDTREGLTRGMSYPDRRRKNTHKPNCRVLTDLNIEEFRRLIVEAFKSNEKDSENRNYLNERGLGDEGYYFSGRFRYKALPVNDGH